jgi:uncharacterized membrane protein (DUF485 family)
MSHPSSVPEQVVSNVAMQTEPAPPEQARYVAVAQSAEFGRLRKVLRGYIFPMTAVFFGWYALYVVLSAFARDFMSTKIVGNINVALVFGVLQFVTTFLIAWLYARWASRRLDPLVDEIRDDMLKGDAR